MKRSTSTPLGFVHRSLLGKKPAHESEYASTRAGAHAASPRHPPTMDSPALSAASPAAESAAGVWKGEGEGELAEDEVEVAGEGWVGERGGSNT